MTDWIERKHWSMPVPPSTHVEICGRDKTQTKRGAAHEFSWEYDPDGEGNVHYYKVLYVQPKRLVDINGDIINEPEHYHESLKWARNMIDKMEADKVDRSDMQVIIQRLSEEVRFTMAMLYDRD